MGPGSPSWVHWESCACSELLSHLSRPNPETLLELNRTRINDSGRLLGIIWDIIFPSNQRKEKKIICGVVEVNFAKEKNGVEIKVPQTLHLFKESRSGILIRSKLAPRTPVK